jgi:hypothetical protein
MARLRISASALRPVPHCSGGIAIFGAPAEDASSQHNSDNPL